MADSNIDPYSVSRDSIQEPPATIARALRKIGPGLILAGSIVGTGELIATTQTGTQAGFVLLWLVILSCFIKVFVQIELGRHAVSSGETTLASFRSLPGPGELLVWWWLIMMLVTQTQMGAMVGGVGQAAHMALPAVTPAIAGWFGSSTRDYLLGRPDLPWAALTALGTSAMLASGSYRIVEQVTTAMVVLFTLMTVGCVLMLYRTDHAVSASDLASGFTFQIPAAAVMSAFAMFGITGVGASELIAYPYWCIEKGYARFAGPRDDSIEWVRRARGWMRVMFADAWVSMVVYTVATVAFYLLGAAVLHGQMAGKGLPSSVQEMLPVLAEMYRPVLGARAATWFIVIGAFAVLYSTLFAATAANSRALSDFIRVNKIVEYTSYRERLAWVRIFCIVFPMIGFGLHIAIGNPPLMVMIGGFVQALTLPMIAAAAVYMRYRRCDPRLLSGRLWDFLLWLSMIGLIGAALYGIKSSYDKLRDTQRKSKAASAAPLDGPASICLACGINRSSTR